MVNRASSYFSKYVQLDENTSIHCSWISVVHVHENTLVYPLCRNDVNGIKPGSNSKMTDMHVAEYSKTSCFGAN